MLKAKTFGLAALCVSYLWLAYAAGHPHVDSEYESHFLHRTASCWVPQTMRAVEPNPAELRYAAVSYPAACRTLRRGWWDPEAWGVWSFGDRATLHLARPPGADMVELTVRGPPDGGPATQTQFDLAGTVTERYILPGMTSTVRLQLPPATQVSSPDLQLSFARYAVLPTVRRLPGDLLTRHVGIGLIAVRFLPERPVDTDGIVLHPL